MERVRESQGNGSDNQSVCGQELTQDNGGFTHGQRDQKFMLPVRCSSENNRMVTAGIRRSMNTLDQKIQARGQTTTNEVLKIKREAADQHQKYWN